MCQYSCKPLTGVVNDWHMVHLGARAVGGAGLVMAEATGVTPEGMISPADSGLWNQQHVEVSAGCVCAWGSGWGGVGGKNERNEGGRGKDGLH